MWKDGLISFRAFNNPRKEQDAVLNKSCLDVQQWSHDQHRVPVTVRWKNSPNLLRVAIWKALCGGMVPCSPRCLVACRFCRHRPAYWRNPALRPGFEEDSALQDSFNVDNETTPCCCPPNLKPFGFVWKQDIPNFDGLSMFIMVHQCVSWFISKCPFSSGYLRVIPFWEKSI